MTTAQGVLRAVFDELDDGDGNAPGHGHEVPGVWDEDNGRELAGKPCEWCATWTLFRELVGKWRLRQSCLSYYTTFVDWTN